MGGFLRSTRLRSAVAVAGLTFVLAIAFGAMGAVSNAKVFGASTSLTVLSGDVLVRHGSGDFVAAADGQVLNEGDTIRTGADARAVLTYFEGSSVTVEPDTQLTIDNAATLADGGTVVVMTQAFGRTWHVVTKLITGSSKYDVRTPASTASVRGTEFEVNSDEDQTTVSTTEGTVVAHVNDPTQRGVTVDVPVTAGMTQTQSKDDAPGAVKLGAEPERVVTVAVGAQNSLVVDPVGRSNGFTKDGKKVVQTPGAQVTRVDGKIVITLPDLPDGVVATRVEKLSPEDDDDVDVEATLQQRGEAPVDLKEHARPDGSAKTAGFEFKKNSGKAEGRALDEQPLPSPRTGTAAQTVVNGPHGTKRLVTPAAPAQKKNDRGNDAPASTPRVPVPTPTKRG
jgi:FecR protein